MQFLAIIAALLASSAFTVLAAPAPEKQSPADNCPNGWYYCGVWNYFFLSFFSYLYYADRKKKHLTPLLSSPPRYATEPHAGCMNSTSKLSKRKVKANCSFLGLYILIIDNLLCSDCDIGKVRLSPD